MSFVRATALDDLWDGDMEGHVLEGRKVLVVRIGAQVYAYEDRCAHLGMRLSEGKLEDCVLTCSAHLYQYDVCTGEGINPTTVKLTALPVRIEDGGVFVDVGGNAS